MSNASEKIQIMLVDDSAVIRGALTKMIQPHSDIEIVSTAGNGEIAVTNAERHKPDIMILDIEMPVMDGLTALPEILKVSPETKIIMFSSLSDKGADVTIKALSLGAVECIVKPSSAQVIGEESDFQRNLISTLRSLAPARKQATAAAPKQTPAPEQQTAPQTEPEPSVQAEPAPPPPKPKEIQLRAETTPMAKPQLIAIGSSTGGPQALFEVISHFKDFNVPIVLTQHMPKTFTRILAEHIHQKTGVVAYEGENGMVVENGHVYVAPGDFHMKLTRGDNAQVVIQLDDGPQINFCRPSVDPMFESAIALYGRRILGVMLTGMGNDGLDGSELLVKAGGHLIAQDEETSVVWGMPGAVAEAGLCSKILPLKEIGPWVRQAVLG